MDGSAPVHAAQGSRRPKKRELAGCGGGRRQSAFEKHSAREGNRRCAGGIQPKWRGSASRTGLSLEAGRSRMGRGQQCKVLEKHQGGGQTLLSKSGNRQLHKSNSGRQGELV